MTSAPVPIRLSHVSLVYEGGVAALDDVSLEVARGERVCVLGANGSGKSTLASVICGLLAPDAGAVELVGERVCADGRPDLEAYRRARRNLGLVFQNPDDQIVTSVVEDDVTFGPENLGLPREEIAARVARELHRVALDDYAKADPSRLSGGQKQRVTIAGALAMEPDVLVLDEPGSLLDVRGRSAILRVMGRLAKAGTTLVHVTHFMEEAVEADRVIVLDRGHIALEGTPDEVFAHGAELLELGLEVPFAARLSQRLGLPWTCSEKDVVDNLCELGTVPNSQKSLMDRRSQHIKNVCELGTVPILQVEHASFSYSGRAQALDDVSLAVAPGVSTAIIGQTGSGKSTLLRLLCGLEVPDSGRVVVAGNDASTKRGRKAVRGVVGYVMQHPERQLFAETVEKDVAFGPRNLRLSADEVSRRVNRARHPPSSSPEASAASARSRASSPWSPRSSSSTSPRPASTRAAVRCFAASSCASASGASPSFRSRTRWRTPRAATASSPSTSRASSPSGRRARSSRPRTRNASRRAASASRARCAWHASSSAGAGPRSASLSPQTSLSWRSVRR